MGFYVHFMSTSLSTLSLHSSSLCSHGVFLAFLPHFHLVGMHCSWAWRRRSLQFNQPSVFQGSIPWALPSRSLKSPKSALLNYRNEFIVGPPHCPEELQLHHLTLMQPLLPWSRKFPPALPCWWAQGPVLHLLLAPQSLVRKLLMHSRNLPNLCPSHVHQPSQHGCVRGRSCLTNLISSSDRVTATRDRGRRNISGCTRRALDWI